jgi:hypothetical protein
MVVMSVLGVAAALPSTGSSTPPPQLWGFHTAGTKPLVVPRGARAIVVQLQNVTAGSVDQQPAGTSPGDEIVGEGQLVTPQGAGAGLLEIEETLTGLGPESGAGRIQLRGTALLRGGQIDLGGVLRFDPTKIPSVAILGGTGAYRGSRGQLFVHTSGQTTQLMFVLLRS